MNAGLLKRKIAYKTLSILNRFIFKKKRIIIYGGDRLYDNNEAIFSFFLRNTPYNVICLATRHKRYKLRKNVRFVKCNYFTAIYYMATSTVMIDSFLRAIRMKPTKKQLFIQLWHGSPLKKMGNGYKEKDGDYYSKILYPSEFYKIHFKEMFGASDCKMVLNGSPRNDYLFKPFAGEYLSMHQGIRVIWMPTFRHGLGEEETTRDLPILEEGNVNVLNTFLQENEITVFIKPHPLQERSFRKVLSDNFSNIVLIDDQSLDDNGIVLYSFIGAMDALITDYSSVYFDYLLLNRPIGFTIDDFDEYKENRGFLFENPLDYMPGEKVHNIDDLMTFLYHLKYQQDDYAEERAHINALVNHWTDGKNCERLEKLVKQYLE